MAELSPINVAESMAIIDVVRASRGAKLVLEKSDHNRLDDLRSVMISSIIDEPRRVYGFNTGFGDNRNRPTIPDQDLGTIQDNLILSHASGVGQPIETEVVRGAMAVRAHSLTLGFSGVRGSLVDSLCSLANSGLVPVVPVFGSVGASGDLAPLSHMVLPLLRRGQVFVDGVVTTVNKQLLESRGVKCSTYRLSDEFPELESIESSLGPKEGLALNNGTAFMASHLALAVHEFENLLWHLDLAMSLTFESMCGVLDAFWPFVQDLRKHRGINLSSDRILAFLQGSELTSAGGTFGFAQQVRTVAGVVDDVQDDYCLRCASVVHGTALDALKAVKKTVEIELNSVTDNPVVVSGSVRSGAHFHGMPLSFAADQLRTAMAIVGGISERRIAKLMNDKRNYGLPRHLVVDDPHGVKSGWMIAQYSAASMVNELKTRSMPYCVGNVTTGNESEDFVSMGANACRAAYEMVKVLRGIVSIELAAAVRALLIRMDKIATPDDLSGWDQRMSTSAQKVIATFVENGIDVWHTDDRPLSVIFGQVDELVRSEALNPEPTCP